MKRSSAFVYLSLLAAVILFFHGPLFSSPTVSRGIFAACSSR